MSLKAFWAESHVTKKAVAAASASQTWIVRRLPQAKLLTDRRMARVAGDLIDVVVLRRYPSVLARI
jgi:hypothetical protein